jgi:hypothetical protein
MTKVQEQEEVVEHEDEEDEEDDDLGREVDLDDFMDSPSNPQSVKVNSEIRGTMLENNITN